MRHSARLGELGTKRLTSGLGDRLVAPAAIERSSGTSTAGRHHHRRVFVTHIDARASAVT
jgi:hypothetical protein